MITLYPRWFAVKRQLPRGGRYDLKRWLIGFSLPSPSYLVLYLFKEHCRQMGKEVFGEILALIGMKQREEDMEHPMAKVLNIVCCLSKMKIFFR